MRALPPGSRFVRERNQIEIIEEEIENDIWINANDDLRTTNVVKKDVANSIFANFRAKVIQSAIKGFRRQVEAAANALWGMIRRSKIS